VSPAATTTPTARPTSSARSPTASPVHALETASRSPRRPSARPTTTAPPARSASSRPAAKIRRPAWQAATRTRTVVLTSSAPSQPVSRVLAQEAVKRSRRPSAAPRTRTARTGRSASCRPAVKGPRRVSLGATTTPPAPTASAACSPPASRVLARVLARPTRRRAAPTTRTVGMARCVSSRRAARARPSACLAAGRRRIAAPTKYATKSNA